MLTFVAGPSGSGKTNWLIQKANEELQAGNGHIAFVDSDDSHIFSLDHSIRLADANQFGIKNVDQLFGFLGGIISRDFDMEKIYLDGLYQIVELKENFKLLQELLQQLSKDHSVDIFMGLDFIPPADQLDKDAEVIELTSEDAQ